MKIYKIAGIVILVLAIGGIYLIVKRFQPMNPQLSDNQISTTTVKESGQCMFGVLGTTTLYVRPTKDSPKFGEFAPSDQQQLVGGKTIDGWIGFDPGVAQAPNVGPFRLRYLSPESSIVFSGMCSLIPIVESLPPKICYTMAQSDISVYVSKDANSKVVATMHFGDYTKVVATSGKNSSDYANYWINVDTSAGSLHSTVLGWIKAADVNFNGEDCSSLADVKS